MPLLQQLLGAGIAADLPANELPAAVAASRSASGSAGLARVMGWAGSRVLQECFRRRTSPHQQTPGSLRLLAGGVLIEVPLQGRQAAMATDLSHFAEAQPGLVCGGEGAAAEAVAAHPADAQPSRPAC